jgi:hypothetical protein
MLLPAQRQVQGGAQARQIVFCGIDRNRLGNLTLPSDVTGVLLKREFAPTLKLAVRLHPKTDRIVVVSGASRFDARLLAQAREEFQPFEHRFTFTYLAALPLTALLSELSQLPPNTVVLYLTVFLDGRGQALVPHEVAHPPGSRHSVRGRWCSLLPACSSPAGSAAGADDRFDPR